MVPLQIAFLTGLIISGAVGLLFVIYSWWTALSPYLYETVHTHPHPTRSRFIRADADMKRHGSVHGITYRERWERSMWVSTGFFIACLVFTAFYAALFTGEGSFVKVGGEVVYHLRWDALVLAAFIAIAAGHLITRVPIYQIFFALVGSVLTFQALALGARSQSTESAIMYGTISAIIAFCTGMALVYPSQFMWRKYHSLLPHRKWNFKRTAYFIIISVYYALNLILYTLDAANLITDVLDTLGAAIAYVVIDALVLIAFFICTVIGYHRKVSKILVVNTRAPESIHLVQNRDRYTTNVSPPKSFFRQNV